MTDYNLTPGQAWDAMLDGEEIQRIGGLRLSFAHGHVFSNGRPLATVDVYKIFISDKKWRSRKKPRERLLCFHCNVVNAEQSCSRCGKTVSVIREVLDED